MSEAIARSYVLRGDVETAARLLEAFGLPAEDYGADQYRTMIADMAAAIAAVGRPAADPSTGVRVRADGWRLS